MTRLSDRAINVAKAALAKCAANDPWFPQPSEATVLAWAEHIERYNLEAGDVLDGVTTAYDANDSGFKPLPKDITDAARAIRRDRAEREDEAQRQAREDAFDKRAAVIRAERLAIEVAKIAAAKTPGRQFIRPSADPTTNPVLNVACPYEPCHASVGRPCIASSTGQPMREGQRAHPGRIKAAAAGHEHHTTLTLCPACHARPLADAEDTARGCCDHCAPHAAGHPKTNKHRNGGTA